MKKISRDKDNSKNINNKNTNVILGKENINLYGNGYIEDKLGDILLKYLQCHSIK